MFSTKPWLLVTISSLVLYFFTAAGYVDTIDANPSIDTAESLLTNQSFFFDLKNDWPTVYRKIKNEEGKAASKMGLTLPILYLVPVTLSKLITNEEIQQKRLRDFLVSLVNPVLASLLLTFLFLIFEKLNFNTFNSIVLATAVGITTALWPYSKSCGREILQALLLLFIIWSTLEGKPSLTGFFFMLGLLTKLAWIIPAAPLIVWSARSFKKNKKSFLPAYIFIFSGVVIHVVHAAFVWGAPYLTGYSMQTMSPIGSYWSTPFFEGFWAQTFSWDTGIFMYNPILFLILPLLVIKFQRKTFSPLDNACLLSIALQICFYSRWQDPLGGHALGPRYLVVVIPLAFLLLDLHFLEIIKSKAIRPFVALLVVFSFLLQLIFVSVKPQQVHTLASANPQKIKISWLSHVRIFNNKIAGYPEVYNLSTFGGENKIVDLSNHSSLTGFNYWWAHWYREKGRHFEKSS